MNIKPCRINPPNLSPSNKRDLHQDILQCRVRDVGINSRVAPNQATFRKDGLPNYAMPKRLDHIPSMGRLEENGRTTASLAGLVAGERYSLKPSDKCHTAAGFGVDSYECSNHRTKAAKFKISSQEMELHYCEKCAILLASQGFKVERIVERIETNPNLSSRRRLFEQAMNLQVAAPINHAFQEECAGFLKQIVTAQGQCKKIIQSNRDERLKVHNYFGSITSQLDELQHQLKTSITIMVSQQRQEVRSVFDSMDVQFVQRLAELDMADIAFEEITKQITHSMKASLKQYEAAEAMARQRRSLAQIKHKVSVVSGVKGASLEELTPNTDSLRHLAGIIRDCRLGLHSYKSSQCHLSPEPTSSINHHAGDNTMFFSFEKGLIDQPREYVATSFKPELQTTAGPTYSRGELDSNVNVILTNSDDDSAGESPQLQESIVDPDFSKLLANVRTH